MTRIERHLYADRRLNGVALGAIGIGVGVTVGCGFCRLVGPSVATVVATALCTAGKMLDDEASAIAGHLADNDLPAARLRLRSLVGRTTDDLDEAEISRAVIESVAENSVDAVVASLMWAAVAGAPGVFAHRAINTLDAMVGHHTVRYEHFGWASARLDDIANFVPARLAAAAVAGSRPRSAKSIWATVRRDARQHPSPNGGVIEAAYAAALDVRLGGVNHYRSGIENRGTLGDGSPPSAAAIKGAIQLRRHSTAVASLVILAVSSTIRRWSARSARVGGG